jgi:hypothetical protein
MPDAQKPIDYNTMSEDDLQSALHGTLAEVDAVRSRAAEITRSLDAVRTRERLAARLGGLSAAERDLLARDATALVGTLDAQGAARQPQADRPQG